MQSNDHLTVRAAVSVCLLDAAPQRDRNEEIIRRIHFLPDGSIELQTYARAWLPTDTHGAQNLLLAEVHGIKARRLNAKTLTHERFWATQAVGETLRTDGAALETGNSPANVELGNAGRPAAYLSYFRTPFLRLRVSRSSKTRRASLETNALRKRT